MTPPPTPLQLKDVGAAELLRPAPWALAPAPPHTTDGRPPEPERPWLRHSSRRDRQSLRRLPLLPGPGRAADAGESEGKVGAHANHRRTVGAGPRLGEARPAVG